MTGVQTCALPISGLGDFEGIGFGYEANVSSAGNQVQPDMREVSPAVKVTDVFAVADSCSLDCFFVVGVFWFHIDIFP